MLLFSTILAINERMTKETFIELVIKWNQTSPYETNIIHGIEWHGELNARYEDGRLWMEIQEYKNQNIIAVRYEKLDKDGVIWDTDYVMNFSSMKMSVRLDRSYTEDVLGENQKFSTPHFITMLVEGGYLKEDEGLPVLHTPIIIDEDNLECLADIIKGKARYQLPVVYISRTYYDEEPVDVNRLAGRLKGVAHVLVQKRNVTNMKLKKMCDKNNEYYGAVGIYYSNSSIGHKKYLYRSAVGYDKFLLEKVIKEVIQYSNTRMIDSLYTWQGVNNALLRDRLKSQREERLRAELACKKAEEEKIYLLDSINEKEQDIRREAREEATAEANNIIDSFENDMNRLQKQIEELTRVNDSLQYENQGLRMKLQSVDSVPVLYMGQEYEFYQGEIKDMVLSVLSDALSNINPKSRRYDVIKDMVKSNAYERIGEKKGERVKKLLKNYDGMSSRLRQELEEVGFEIKEEGKHYKIIYYGDGRYQTVFAKTPSDGRSGKNNAQIIIKKAF